MKLELSRQILKKYIQISNLMKIRPVGAELFYADRWTDGHDDANGRFSRFCERVWKSSSYFQGYVRRRPVNR